MRPLIVIAAFLATAPWSGVAAARYTNELTGSLAAQVNGCPSSLAFGVSRPTGMSTGDSFSSHPDDWPRKVDNALIVSTAIGGQALIEMETSWPSQLDQYLSTYLISFASIQGGVNDISRFDNDPGIVEKMRDAIRGMRTEAAQRGLDLFLMNIAPWKRNSGWTLRKEARREEYNQWLDGYARDQGLPLIDIDRLLADPSEPDALNPDYDSGDGLHPNAAGHAVIAEDFMRQLLLNGFAYDCSYNAVNPYGLAANGWTGPVLGGAYYRPGESPDVFVNVPDPTDAKTDLALSGTISIDDAGTSATGLDDRLSGSWTVEAGVYHIVGGVVSAELSWTSLRHEFSEVAVDEAVPNAFGGFDYVVASQGFPSSLSPRLAVNSEFYPSPQASIHFSPAGSRVPAWTQPAAAGVAINEGNRGLSTSATVTGFSCKDAGDGVCQSLPGAAEQGYENLLLRVSTDDRMVVRSVDAFYVDEFEVQGPVPGLRAWAGGTLHFGSGKCVTVHGSDDTLSLRQGQTVELDVLANDLCKDDRPVVVTHLSDSGIGTISAQGTGGRISYTAGRAGTETIEYQVTDASGDTDTASIAVTVLAGQTGSSAGSSMNLLELMLMLAGCAVQIPRRARTTGRSSWSFRCTRLRA